mgnify:CR=1 FL=1
MLETLQKIRSPYMEKSPIHGVNQQVTSENWAYLAGLWDGEGYIGISSYNISKGVKYAVNMSITNTNITMINEVIRIMDSIGIKGHVALRNRLNRLPVCEITIRRYDACKILLENLLPFMHSKKDLGILLLRYINKRLETLKVNKPILTFQRNGRISSMAHTDQYTDEDKSLVEQIRALNNPKNRRNLNDYTRPQLQAV